MREEQANSPLPLVVAGVQRSLRELLPDRVGHVGAISGNHDRTSAPDLHDLAWPLVHDWLRTDADRAKDQLEHARSTNRYAGGIAEIWPLAHDGRVATLVVEDRFSVPARIDAHNQIHPADDATHPDVVDDVIDDVIEAVLRTGGSAVIVERDELREHDGIAAVLRY
jgi:hypothetical protein